MLASVTPAKLETTVENAHDRALDEQRVLPTIWKAVHQIVQGPKTRSRVYKAVEGTRKEVSMDHSEQGLDTYATQWIRRTVSKLKEAGDGFPETFLPQDKAVELFHVLFEGMTLPESLMREYESP